MLGITKPLLSYFSPFLRFVRNLRGVFFRVPSPVQQLLAARWIRFLTIPMIPVTDNFPVAGRNSHLNLLDEGIRRLGPIAGFPSGHICLKLVLRCKRCQQRTLTHFSYFSNIPGTSLSLTPLSLFFSSPSHTPHGSHESRTDDQPAAALSEILFGRDSVGPLNTPHRFVSLDESDFCELPAVSDPITAS